MKSLFGFFVLIIVSIVLGSPPSHAGTHYETCNGATIPVLDGDHAICSYSASFSKPCNGLDNIHDWTGPATASPPSDYTWAITPWENHWIRIVGYSIVDNSGPINRTAIGIGSGYSADMMGYLGVGQTAVTKYFPGNQVWMYPPRGYLHGPGDPVKDLHATCWTGTGLASTVNVQVTFHYTSAEGLVLPTLPMPLCTAYATLNPADKASGITLSNGNLTATSNGANSHQMVRATTGISPSTYRVHYEFTISGMGGGGTPINVFGLQDASTPTGNPLGAAGTSFGVGYNTANGYVYSSNFTPAGGPTFAMPNGTYAVEYDSFSGVASVTGPGIIYYVSKTATTFTTLFPGYSAYGSPSGSVTFNFGASPFFYGVSANYQAGLCQ